jgi:uncharacterized membrane protein (UPF0127 family)
VSARGKPPRAIAIALVMGCAGMVVGFGSGGVGSQKLLTKDARPLCVPVATTLQEKTKGLQGVRHPIPMVFLFNPPQRVWFWMKDTPARLTGVWVAPDGIVLGYWRGTPYSLTHHYSAEPVRLVLEYPRGYRLPARGSRVRLDGPCKLRAGTR